MVSEIDPGRMEHWSCIGAASLSDSILLSFCNYSVQVAWFPSSSTWSFNFSNLRWSEALVWHGGTAAGGRLSSTGADTTDGSRQISTSAHTQCEHFLRIHIHSVNTVSMHIQCEHFLRMLIHSVNTGLYSTLCSMQYPQFIWRYTHCEHILHSSVNSVQNTQLHSPQSTFS